MITKAILLYCEPPKAFELFTARISDWWPPERRHTKDAQSTITLSEKGRFFERDNSGNEVELGKVLAWEAPRRVLLDWYPGTDRDHPTQVEVLFLPEKEGTRVVVVHAAKPESEALFPLRAPRYEASWDLVLGALLKASQP